MPQFYRTTFQIKCMVRIIQFVKSTFLSKIQLLRLKNYVEIIYETAFCFQFPITLIFWSFLFKILIDAGATFGQIIMNTNLHAGPIVCLSVEMYYNTFRFPKKHLWVLISFGSVYLFINLVYSVTVAVIYKPIDWKSLLSYILVLMSLGFTVGAHYLGQYIHKKYKAPKLKNRIQEGLIQDNSYYNGEIQNNNSQGQKYQNSQSTGTNPYRLTKQQNQKGPKKDSQSKGDAPTDGEALL